ncbi:hypothetical protein [Nostoc sp. DSM 114161]|uniref:hypothetical protein n=1 Tax=Nostoc sp. DSM 114161 TaxID=3440143 RepID=UPI004045474C
MMKLTPIDVFHSTSSFETLVILLTSINQRVAYQSSCMRASSLSFTATVVNYKSEQLTFYRDVYAPADLLPPI